MSEYALPKAYDFKETEKRIYSMWESGGYFQPLFPDQNNVPSGYTNAYPGAPRTIYGTISYQF